MGIPAFEVEQTGSGYRYDLPARDLAGLSKLGWIAVAIGFLISAFMVGWMWMPIQEGINMLRQQNWFGLALIAFGAAGLIGLSFGVLALCGGIAVVRNRLRCVVEIRNGYLYSTEVLGWVKWKRRTKISDIIRLELYSDPEVDDNVASLANGIFRDLMVIVAVKSDKKTKGRMPDGFLVAPGYHRELLEPLANQLAAHLNKELAFEAKQGSEDDVLSAIGIASVHVVDKTGAESEPVVYKQPSDSRIEVAEFEESLAFKVPRLGLRKGAGFLLGFGLLWLIFSISAVVAAIGGNMENADTVGWIILPLFLLVGIGITLAGWNIAIRSDMIGVANGLLFIEKKSLFRTSWKEFQATDISRIEVGASGMEVNDVPVMELEIYDNLGEKTGLLSRLDDDELRWLAQELSAALELKPSNATEQLSENAQTMQSWPEPPHGSRIEWRSLGGDSHQWTIRPKSSGWVASGFTAVGVLNSFVVGVYGLMNGWDLVLCLILMLMVPAVLSIVVLISLTMSTRGYRITTSETEVEFVAQGVFAGKPNVVERHSVRSVKMSDSGWTVNNKKIKQMVVKREEGPPVIAMFNCEPFEIGYLIAHLQAWAGIDTSGDGPMPNERLSPESDAAPPT